MVEREVGNAVGREFVRKNEIGVGMKATVGFVGEDRAVVFFLWEGKT